MADDATASAAPPSGGRGASEIRDIADGIRSRVDLFGKTLAAVATLGTTAVGLSKIGDLFPVGDEWPWAILACAGLGAAALAAIGIAVRLMMVARPVFVSPNSTYDFELDSDERDEVSRIGKGAAERFGYSSLAGLQERERSLRSSAARATDETERARRLALADDAKTEIEQALARSQVAVVRRRATEAIRGDAWWLYIAVIAGLIAFAVGTDKVSSSRKDLIAEAKACGDARKAGATAKELKATEVCEAKADPAADKADGPAAGSAKPATAAEARALILGQLSDALTACVALVQETGALMAAPWSTRTVIPSAKLSPLWIPPFLRDRRRLRRCVAREVGFTEKRARCQHCYVHKHKGAAP